MLVNPFVQPRSPSNAPASFTFATLPTATSVAPRHPFFVSDVGVNGSWWFSNGTKWAPINGSVVLMQNNTPWISLSSGSIAAGGGISGITALRLVYPKAWCYFPANAVATVAAAGWRYCTFSTTTAGVAFLDQPAASFPITWPSSPTAVTDGKGAYTGAGTGSAILYTPTITVPASAIGINGRVRSEWTAMHAGTATSVLKSGVIDANDTTPSSAQGLPSNNAGRGINDFFNAGATAANMMAAGAFAAGNVVNQNASLQTIDTASSHTFAAGLQAVASAVDNIELTSLIVTLFNDGQ